MLSARHVLLLNRVLKCFPGSVELALFYAAESAEELVEEGLKDISTFLDTLSRKNVVGIGIHGHVP
jgi:hypothetical protein